MTQIDETLPEEPSIYSEFDTNESRSAATYVASSAKSQSDMSKKQQKRRGRKPVNFELYQQECLDKIQKWRDELRDPKNKDNTAMKVARRNKISAQQSRLQKKLLLNKSTDLV